MKTTLLCFALMFLIGSGLNTTLAQQDDVAQEQETSINDQLDNIKTELNDAISGMREEFEAAENEEGRQQVIAKRRELELELVTRAVGLTSENDDDANDIQVLMWLISKTKGEGRDLAFKTIMKDHIEAENLYVLADQLGRARLTPEPDIEHYLRQLIEHSTHDRVKGIATLSLAGLIDRLSTLRNAQKDNLQTRLGDEWREFADSWSGDKGTEEVRRLLESCVEEFADVRARGRGTIGEQAASQLVQMNLVVGREAPDIEGEDLDGVAFKLSDYRGKVVMLDFWGDW